MSGLTEAELALLRRVAQCRVGFSRQRYFLLEPGQPDAPPEIHTLRARGLVVLRRAAPGRRLGPTQMCMTTAKADRILEELADVDA